LKSSNNKNAPAKGVRMSWKLFKYLIGIGIFLLAMTFSTSATEVVRVNVNSQGIFLNNAQVNVMDVVNLAKRYTSNLSLEMEVESEFQKYQHAKFFDSDNKLIVDFKIEYSADASNFFCVFTECSS
jgi:hypothetical protein